MAYLPVPAPGVPSRVKPPESIGRVDTAGPGGRWAPEDLHRHEIPAETPRLRVVVIGMAARACRETQRRTIRQVEARGQVSRTWIYRVENAIGGLYLWRQRYGKLLQIYGPNFALAYRQALRAAMDPRNHADPPGTAWLGASHAAAVLGSRGVDIKSEVADVSEFDLG